MVNYKQLRLNNLYSPQFRHLLLLIYWVIYGLMFLFVERAITLDYHVIECSLDRKIPFCEFFIIPYYFWYAFLVFINLYTLFFDIPTFKKLMYFIIIANTATIIFYLIYPNMQELRPTEFARDNIFTDMVKNLYIIDTNTNVCPSLHVIDSFAVLFAAWIAKGLNKPLWRTVFLILTVLISISTLFLKQHSVIDVVSASALCLAVYPFAFIFPDLIIKMRQKK